MNVRERRVSNITPTRTILSIPNNGVEGGAIIERTISNARYGVGEGDGGEGGAIIERIASNAGYGVGDGG